jgi:TonB family protein
MKLSGATAIAILVFCGQTAAAQSNVSVRFVAEDGTKIQYNQADRLFELHGGPGWIRSPTPFGDFVLAFDVRAMTAESRPEVIVRAAYAQNRNDRLRGYRIALLPPAQSQKSSRLIGKQPGVKVVEELTVLPAGLEQWQRVVVSAIGPKITVAVDGTRVATYEVEELAGHLIFANPKGLAHLRNVQIDAVPPAIADSTPPMLDDDLEKAGGRLPRLVHEVKPSYTREAMRSMTQGKVLLTAIVRADGSVDDVRVTRSLEPGLDVMAVAAVRRWRFTPAYLNGAPVPVVIKVEMSFTLK